MSEFEKARDEAADARQEAITSTKDTIIHVGTWRHNYNLGADWAKEWCDDRTLRYDRIIKEQAANLSIAVEALEKISNHSARETNGLTEYRGDTYGFILKLCTTALTKIKGDPIS